MHDALDMSDLFWDEVAQRRETGYRVDAAVAAAEDVDFADRAAAAALLDSLQDLPRSPDWGYEEPNALADIVAVLPTPARSQAPSAAHVEDRVHAAWLGRIAGCNLGKPVEMGTHWTSAHLREYLELAEAYPLLDYIPVLDPMPERFELRENWPGTTRGNVNGSARDDDIDYPILGLHLLEQHGTALSPAHGARVAAAAAVHAGLHGGAGGIPQPGARPRPDRGGEPPQPVPGMDRCPDPRRTKTRQYVR